MKYLTLFFVMFFFSASSLFSQIDFSAKTGDQEFDASLADINVNAKADLPLFKKDLSLRFNIPLPKIDVMIGKMQPADVYMACELGKQTGKTIDQVAQAYEANKGKGWGVIAKQLGIKPGSPEFHALKNSAKEKNMKGKGKSNGNGNNNGNGRGNGHSHGNGKKK